MFMIRKFDGQNELYAKAQVKRDTVPRRWNYGNISVIYLSALMICGKISKKIQIRHYVVDELKIKNNKIT